MALSINPTPTGQDQSVKAAYQRFQALFAAGKATEAHAALERLLRDFPHFAVAHNDMGVLCYHRGEKEKARQHYEEAVRLASGNGMFKKNLADFLYVESGRTEAALQLYLEVLAANPRDTETLLILGNISIALEKMDEAWIFFGKVLEIDPDDSTARQSLAVLQQAGGRRELQAPTDALYKNAQELAGAGRTGQAIDTLRELIAAQPGNATAHNDLGVLYFKTGNKLRSLYHYTKAERLAPENCTFRKNLADFYFAEMGETGEALELYQAALEQAPNDIETLQNLGQLYTAANRIGDAEAVFKRML